MIVTVNWQQGLSTSLSNWTWAWNQRSRLDKAVSIDNRKYSYNKLKGPQSMLVESSSSKNTKMSVLKTRWRYITEREEQQPCYYHASLENIECYQMLTTQKPSYLSGLIRLHTPSRTCGPAAAITYSSSKLNSRVCLKSVSSCITCNLEQSACLNPSHLTFYFPLLSNVC